MRRHSLFLLVIAFMLVGTSRVMGQDFSASNNELHGIWQMCFYVSGDPTSAGDLKPSNSFKILTEDGEFINMTVIPNHGAIIIGSGTYTKSATNAFTEHVEANLHLPQLVGTDNVMEYEMREDDVMIVKFFVKTDKDGNEINSWYHETWKKVVMPPTYPEDLVR